MAIPFRSRLARKARLFSGEVDQVDVPGVRGRFRRAGRPRAADRDAAARHSDHLSRGGTLRVVVNGGFAEVGPAGLTVLADFAVPVEDFDKALARQPRWTRHEESAAKAPEGATQDKLTHRSISSSRCRANCTLTHPGAGTRVVPRCDTISDRIRGGHAPRRAGRRIASAITSRQTSEFLHHALVDRALERHDEGGQVGDRLPAPGHEFGLVPAAGMRDVDLAARRR